MDRFYFDHNATTPVSATVLQAYLSALRETFGNSSSVHSFGQEARRALEEAREKVARLLGCEAREVVFTSGGTESNNLAILGAVRNRAGRTRHVITSEIEHPAVLNACQQLEREGVALTYLPVSLAGVVDPDDVRSALRPETVLISVMHVNNETGAIQPLQAIAAVAREAGVPLHSDGVQAAGKLPLEGAASMAGLYAISGHKFHAPKGIGALRVAAGTELAPLMSGGHQERDRRPGTPNVPSAVAMGVAADSLYDLEAESARLRSLRDLLEQSVLESVPDAGVNARQAPRVPNTANMYFDGLSAEALLIALDLRGFAVSTGSACSSGAVEPSHVLTAMGLSRERARASLRFSLGRSNTAEQVAELARAVVDSVRHLRRLSPTYV